MRFARLKKTTCVVFAALIFFVGKSAFAYSLGEVKTFRVDKSYDYADRVENVAVLLYAGEKSLVYVEQGWWDSLSDKEGAKKNIVDLAVQFDNTIYPKMTKVFGSEWSPGIDNEYHITILISKMKEGAGGYFNSADEFPKSEASDSNEREMLYLSTSYINSSWGKNFLAHEFQHLINFYQKDKLRNVVEETWLNEARSEYAGTLCGFDDVFVGSNLERRINEFLRKPWDSLTEWNNETVDYGSVNLFMQYFVARYGEQALTKMMQSDSVGIESINNALASLGFAERFSDVYANWTVANYVNDCKVGSNFCYLNPALTYARLHVNPNTSNAIEIKEGSSFKYSDNLKDWSSHWYQILPSGSGLNLLVSFNEGQQTGFKIPVLIKRVGGIRTVKFISLSSIKSGSELFIDFGGNITEIVLMPFSELKQKGFFSSEPSYSFSYDFLVTSKTENNSLSSITPSQTAMSSLPNLSDGSLIRAKGDYKVYVISGKYKRWIQSAKIFSFYPHFGWQKVVEVTPAQRDSYIDAWLIRADGDTKVYEVNSDLTKHWLNITAAQFSSSGRLWDMVFLINKQERDLYKTGAAILK